LYSSFRPAYDNSRRVRKNNSCKQIDS
jgi:hypothetical protein